MNLISFVVHTYKALLNGKSLPAFVFSFLIGFSPVVLWLVLFKNASIIPTDWRPTINVKWLPLADDLCFNPSNPSAYLFYLFFLLFFILPLSLAIFIHAKNKLLFSLVVLAWPLLNTVNYLAGLTQNHKLDLLSFFSYVLLHIIVPIVTSIYLYLFHIPGAMACYSWSLGLQNILGLSTHILIPSSPPWFIHINGINATADYSTLGYAAGLIRIDTALGTHMTSNGFHKSPIVFGALPSLHSAMAVLSCVYISWFTHSITLSLLSISFVLLQWWSTIYLDHHWRLDLLMGMCYALMSFTILKTFNSKIFHHEAVVTSTITTPPHFDLTSTDTLINHDYDLDMDSLDEYDLELQSLNYNNNNTDTNTDLGLPRIDMVNLRKYNDNNSSSSSLTATSNDDIENMSKNNNINTTFTYQHKDIRPAGLRVFHGTCLEFLFT